MKKTLLLILAVMVGFVAQAWTVKFTNPNNWAQVAVWAWDDYSNYTGGTWPGKLMTKNGDVWEYTGTGTPTKIIFNNNNKGSQTGNLDFVDGATYNMTGPVNAKLNDYSVYFEDTAGWGTVYIYGWNGNPFGGYPGTELKKDASGKYVCTVQGTSEPEFDGIQFNNGQDGSAEKKTADLKWETGKTYNNGSATPNPGPDPTPGDYSGWYLNVSGTFNNWNPEGSQYSCPLSTEGVGEVKNLAIGTGEFELKIWDGNDNHYYGTATAIDTDTPYVVGNNGMGTHMTINGATATSKYNVSYDAATSIMVVTKVAGEEPDPIEPDPVDPTEKDLYLVGENYGNWAKDEAYKMTRNENVYTIELTDGLSGKWKIWDGSWDYSFGAGGSQPVVGTAAEVWFNSATDFTTSTTGKTTITLTVTEGSDAAGSSIPAQLLIEASVVNPDPVEPDPVDPTALDFYIVGENYGNWAKDEAYKMTRNENVYTIEMPNGISGEWKIFDGTATFDVSFGAGADQPVADIPAEVWFNSQTNFTFNTTSKATITFTLVDGSAVEGSSIPSTLLIAVDENDVPNPEPPVTDYSGWYVNIGCDNWKISDDTYWNGKSVPADGVVSFSALALSNMEFAIKVWDGTNKKDLFYYAENIVLGTPTQTTLADEQKPSTIEGAEADARYDLTFDVATNVVTITKVEGPVVEVVQYFIHGQFAAPVAQTALFANENSWYDYELEKNADGKYAATVVADAAEGEFLINKTVNGEAKEWYKVPEGTTITLGEPLTLSTDNNGNIKYTATAGQAYQIVFDPETKAATMSVTTGIEGVAADAAEARYYNLQGVQVVPAPGQVYIVVRGNNVTKEYVK